MRLKPQHSAHNCGEQRNNTKIIMSSNTVDAPVSGRALHVSWRVPERGVERICQMLIKMLDTNSVLFHVRTWGDNSPFQGSTQVYQGPSH
jgi:hypothetical protein